MKPRVSISDEALSEMSLALEYAASERMLGEVAREPWVGLHLEQTAEDAASDRYPIVCRDGMAPIVVACIRAASKAADDPSIKRELSRASKAVQAAYGVQDVPTMIQSLKVMEERRMIVPEVEASQSSGQWIAVGGKHGQRHIGCVTGFAIVAAVFVLMVILFQLLL